MRNGVYCKKGTGRWARSPFSSRENLQVLLVGLDHLLDHLAAHGTGLTGADVAVVALLQVDANLPWCTSSILSGLFSRTFSAVFSQFSNKFVEDTHALPVGLIGPGGNLVSAVFIDLGANLDAVYKGD